MTTLEGMRPRVEIYSIDDAFCDLTFKMAVIGC